VVSSYLIRLIGKLFAQLCLLFAEYPRIVSFNTNESLLHRCVIFATLFAEQSDASDEDSGGGAYRGHSQKEYTLTLRCAPKIRDIIVQSLIENELFCFC